MIINELPLTHFSSRGGKTIDTIVLHYPAPNLLWEDPYSPTAIHALLEKEELSYHYFVTKIGEVYRFVDEKYKAWHAGNSSLFGDSNINPRSVGVCLQNNGGENYPIDQLAGASMLCEEICERYSIPYNRIVGHCHVSPGRKIDPGPKFPWVPFFHSLCTNRAK